MFFIVRPSDNRILKLLRNHSKLPFAYPEVGATRDAPPTGYPVNSHRIFLGRGRRYYDRGVEAVKQWSMYAMPWTTIYPDNAPIEPGVVVGVLVRHFGFWSLNPCRIVYVIDETNDVTRFGFAFGTLPNHAERGEERFTVEWNSADDTVWFEIFTFAKGQHPLVRAAWPAMRYTQQRFGKASIQQVRSIVQSITTFSF